MDLTRWREIIKKNSSGGLLLGTTDLYIRGVLSQVPRFAKLASSPTTRFMVGDARAGKRSVRGIIMLAQGKQILVSMSALQGKKQTNKQKVLACMRELIGEQIADYKAKRKVSLESDPFCPLSGVDLRKCKSCHVDHYTVSFKKLSTDWAKLEKVDFDSVKIQGRPGKLCFAAPLLNQSWRRYHAIHADLQMVDATANLKKGAKSIVEYKMRSQ